jgi:hypothetical protein
MHTHFTTEEIQANLAELGESPKDNGTIEMLVSRPAEGERTVIEEAHLDTVVGMHGDNWQARGSKYTEDGSAIPDAQITLMNSRVIQALTQDRSRWQWAGDQLFVDLDLSAENLPVGTRLAIGSAILEITAMPHNGCDKFTERYGHDAIRFVNSKTGRQARNRGIYAKVVQSGTIRTGDTVTKVAVPSMA